MPDLLDTLGGGLKAAGRYARRAKGEAGLEEARLAQAGLYNQRADLEKQEAQASMMEMRRQAFIQDAQVARTLVEQGRPDLAQGLLQQRIQVGSQLGLDMSDTQMGLQMLESGDTESFMQTTGAILSQWQQRQAAAQAGETKVQFGETGKMVQLDDGSWARSIPRMNPATGQVEEVIVPVTGTPVNSMGMTPEQAVSFEGSKAGARETSKGSAGRQQETINVGLRSAQQLPVLRRTRSLLDELETGGFAGAATKVRNALGISGADESELTTNMARAVLSQLRDVFGAQFTEREGARLEKIEAGIGKSTEGNKRILDGLLKMAEFKADRAIQAAKSTNDFSVIQEIESYMNMDMSLETAAPTGTVDWNDL